jgi:DNA polymerase
MNTPVDNEAALAAARRYLEDLELFEGRFFPVPAVSVESALEQQRPRQAADASVDEVEPAVVESELPAAGLVDGAEPQAGDSHMEDRSVAVAAQVSPVDSAIGAAGPLAAVSVSAEPTTENELEVFRTQISDCTRCGLAQTRQNFVFGSGRVDAGILFVGEAPGADEDRQGLPFVGASGQLLTKIIEAMGLRREDVFICNILKCRPPKNRDPQEEEIQQCEPYLKRQIEIIQPKVICTLGRFAAQTLLRNSESMGRLRTQTHHYEGIPLIATYHPAALLRNPQWKRPTWEDIKKVRRAYDGVEL